MNTRSPDAAKVYVLALILPWAAAIPTLGFGYTREDWLFLWTALDPQSAPAGATGSFARPVAFSLWKAATAAGGDHPLAMHAIMLVLATAFILGLVRLLLRLGVHSTPAILMATLVCGSHAALVELRLWASASNGLLAGALGVWGAALLLSPRWRVPGAVLLVLAAGARADAWFFSVTPLAVAWGSATPRRRAILAGIAVALLLPLAWYAWGHGSGLHLANTGELARRLVWPWGPALPAAVAAVVGGLAILVLGAVKARVRDDVYRLAALLVLLPLLGAAFVPWAPAGRYLLVPVVGVSIAVGRWTLGQRVPTAMPLIVWATLNLGSNWVGNTARELWERSSAEVSLYRAVQDVDPDGRTLELVHAPPMGWLGEAADAENVASVAARRPVTVRLVASASVADSVVALSYVNGSWRLVR